MGAKGQPGDGAAAGAQNLRFIAYQPRMTTQCGSSEYDWDS
jgi:hypothetical protein